MYCNMDQKHIDTKMHQMFRSKPKSNLTLDEPKQLACLFLDQKGINTIKIYTQCQQLFNYSGHIISIYYYYRSKIKVNTPRAVKRTTNTVNGNIRDQCLI